MELVYRFLGAFALSVGSFFFLILIIMWIKGDLRFTKWKKKFKALKDELDKKD